MEMRVCILDYGSGNACSVYNMFSSLSKAVTISNDPAVMRDATHIVLPGVGAFGTAMRKVQSQIPLDVLEKEVRTKGKPFLGICVGMQLLAERGFEFGEHKGLGWLRGEVRRLEAGALPIPHIGWNDVEVIRGGGLFSSFKGQPDFYFLHSYCFMGHDPEDLVARCTYGQSFPCVLSRGNIHGVQFHPEKSQRAGRELIQKFLQIT